MVLETHLVSRGLHSSQGKPGMIVIVKKKKKIVDNVDYLKKSEWM